MLHVHRRNIKIYYTTVFNAIWWNKINKEGGYTLPIVNKTASLKIPMFLMNCSILFKIKVNVKQLLCVLTLLLITNDSTNTELEELTIGRILLCLFIISHPFDKPEDNGGGYSSPHI